MRCFRTLSAAILAGLLASLAATRGAREGPLRGRHDRRAQLPDEGSDRGGLSLPTSVPHQRPHLCAHRRRRTAGARPIFDIRTGARRLTQCPARPLPVKTRSNTMGRSAVNCRCLSRWFRSTFTPLLTARRNPAAGRPAASRSSAEHDRTSPRPWHPAAGAVSGWTAAA